MSTGGRARVRCVVAYDGTDFHGFAPNAGVRTVAGVLADALERVIGHPVEITCAGRTDAGVHAWGQVVSFDADAARFEAAEVRHAVTRLCGPEIVVRTAEVAPEGFSARFDATSRRYRYVVVNRPEPDPFLHRYAWHVPQPLDVELLRLGCDPLIGEHDFSSFCRRPRVVSDDRAPSLTRRVTDARWVAGDDGVLTLWIAANAFCHQMVRSIVGLLVAVGRGRVPAGEIRSIVAARDRNAAPEPAPPHGLTLWSVDYPN